MVRSDDRPLPWAFVFDWSYFWISPVIAFFASWAARGVLKFSESDEELFDELSEGEKKSALSACVLPPSVAASSGPKTGVA